ncbi:hypothetical protein, partial [Klebsiella aerogenes]|uniref:hypothetical protein n=1 Tax=Klebsiella aerogenes TaxID=548 RepID=UPI0013D80BF1
MQHFPAALCLDGLLVVGPVGFPGGATPGRATGWCGLWGFPAALRLAGLLVGGAACGMGSPGEAFMP